MFPDSGRGHHKRVNRIYLVKYNRVYILLQTTLWPSKPNTDLAHHLMQLEPAIVHVASWLAAFSPICSLIGKIIIYLCVCDRFLHRLKNIWWTIWHKLCIVCTDWSAQNCKQTLSDVNWRHISVWGLFGQDLITEERAKLTDKYTQ